MVGSQINKRAEYYAEMYFVLRRFPFKDSIRYKSLPIKDATEKYCQDLLRNTAVRNRIQQDMESELYLSKSEQDLDDNCNY